MKRIGKLVVFGMVAGALTAACSGGNGGGDPSQVSDKLKNPTGTFEEGKASDVGAKGAETQESAAGVNAAAAANPFGGLMGMAGGASANSADADAEAALGARELGLRAFGQSRNGLSGGGMQCDTSKASGGQGGDSASASIPCTCEGGGTAQIDVTVTGLQKMQTGGGAFKMTMNASFAACTVGDAKLDAAMNMLLDAPEGLKFSSSGSSDAAAVKAQWAKITYAFSAKGTLTKGSETLKFDLGWGYSDGEMYYLVDQADGSVGVRTQNWKKETKSGTVYVKAKNGRFKCTVENGSSKCEQLK